MQKPEAYGESKPCPYKENITCHKAICSNCDYKPPLVGEESLYNPLWMDE